MLEPNIFCMSFCKTKLEFPWHCDDGIGGTPIGSVFRVSFEECKNVFQGFAGNFIYYQGSKHCQETTSYTRGVTNENTDWMSCTQSK